MTLPRQAWIGIGALAMIGAVAAVLPPTKPIGQPLPPPSRDAGLSAAPPLPAPLVPEEPREEQLRAAPSQAAPRQAIPDSRPVDDARGEESPPDEEQADEDAPPAVSPDIDAAFRAGYRWADQMEIDDPRDCRRWRGSPAEDGCRAKVREGQRSEEADEPRSPWIGGF